MLDVFPPPVSNEAGSVSKLKVTSSVLCSEMVGLHICKTIFPDSRACWLAVRFCQQGALEGVWKEKQLTVILLFPFCSPSPGRVTSALLLQPLHLGNQFPVLTVEIPRASSFPAWSLTIQASLCLTHLCIPWAGSGPEGTARFTQQRFNSCSLSR